MSDRIAPILTAAIGLWFLTFLLTGCASDPKIKWRIRTVEIEVPVQVRREPPSELISVPALPRPLFVHPDAETASSALTPEGETELQGLILELLARERAWRAWATD